MKVMASSRIVENVSLKYNMPLAGNAVVHIADAAALAACEGTLLLTVDIRVGVEKI